MLERGAARARQLGVLAVVLLVSAVGEAGVFQFVDDAGVAHYTNVPSDPRFQALPGWVEQLTGARAVAPLRPLTRLREWIRTVAERYGVDQRLIEAVIAVESGGNPRAVSPKGATGLMQLMPQTAAELGVRNPFDPQENLDGGVRHLRDLLVRFAGDVVLALAAYNAGEEAVRTYGGVPPYRETQDYVRKIRGLYTDGVQLRVAPILRPAPAQQTYQETADDGSVVYTNLPPAPSALKRSF